MGPTGKSAYLLKGNTIHSILRILVSQSLNYKSTSNDVLNSLRTKLRRLNFIIIDEVSMVGVQMQVFIHKSCKKLWAVQRTLVEYLLYLLEIFINYRQFVMNTALKPVEGLFTTGY